MFYVNTNFIVPGIDRRLGFFPSLEIAKAHVRSQPGYLRARMVIGFRRNVAGFPPLEMSPEVIKMMEGVNNGFAQ